MPIEPRYFVYTVNAVLLLLVMYLGIRITNAGVTYSWNQGDSDIQTALKWIILKSLLLLMAMALFAIIFNLLAASLA